MYGVRESQGEEGEAVGIDGEEDVGGDEGGR